MRLNDATESSNTFVSHKAIIALIYKKYAVAIARASPKAELFSILLYNSFL